MKPICIALALVVAGISLAQKPVNVPPDIRAIYVAQSDDLKTGDLAGFFSYYDPSFVAIDPKGKKETFAQLKKDVEGMVKGSKSRSMKIVFTSCVVKPGVVQVSYVADATMTSMKGKTTKVREIGTDTWKKRAGGWKETKTVDKSFGPIK